MEQPRQQLIIIFESDICQIERIIDEADKGGPRYKSPAGQKPVVISVLAVTTEIFEALHRSRADFIMTTIGMESENVFSQGEISQSLFFNRHKRVKKIASVDYTIELRKSLEREDYEEASIIRDIIANLKTEKDLKAFRKRLALRK